MQTINFLLLGLTRLWIDLTIFHTRGNYTNTYIAETGWLNMENICQNQKHVYTRYWKLLQYTTTNNYIMKKIKVDMTTSWKDCQRFNFILKADRINNLSIKIYLFQI